MKHGKQVITLVAVLTAATLIGAAAAQTPFGWRVAPTAWTFREFTFFEAVDKTASLGMSYIEAFQGQRIRSDSEDKMDATLSDEAIQQIRAKLDEAKVKLTSIYIHSIPGDEAACRPIFEFARKLGVEFIVSEPEPEALDVIEKCCNEFGINLAIHNHAEGKSKYWNPEYVREVCEGRGPRVGVCGDTGHWIRSGLKPADCARILGKRLLAVHLKDLNKFGQDATDVPWGQGVGELDVFLQTLRELHVNPALFGIEYESNWDNNMPQADACNKWFQETVGAMAAVANREDPLFIGWASASITPEKPASLAGQHGRRISTQVLDPVTATALALETRGPNGETEQAVLLSVDLVMVPKMIVDRIREAVAARVPELNADKICVNATHTHTAPVLIDGTFNKAYGVSDMPEVTQFEEYQQFFVQQTSNAIVEAWQKREPAGMSWALGSAATGICRRARYADGTALMYGDTTRADFLGLEGGTDPGVELLFFWRPDQSLSGVLINIACPSQEVEHLSEISADFWHDVRLELRKRHDPNLFILPQCSSAGDVSPHPMFRKAAEEAMLKRSGLARRQELARRIANAVDDTLATANQDVKTALVLRHELVDLDLPEMDPPRTPFYETDSVHPIRYHVLRIGDVAMASNPFELFLDYGVRIKARSTKPILTFLVQIADGQSGYLPTPEAIAGGHYSADKFIVSPEGAQLYVDETVARISDLWP